MFKFGKDQHKKPKLEKMFKSKKVQNLKRSKMKKVHSLKKFKIFV
jgi:hypothetical protein